MGGDASAVALSSLYANQAKQFRIVAEMAQSEPALSEIDKTLARVREAAAARAAAEALKPPPPAKIVQFPLPFPDDTPPVSNVIARSALFAAIKSKDRRTMKYEIVASQDGIEISFTGEQLNQDDHDNFMQLVKLASCRPLGQTVIVPANAILRACNRGTGKSQHDQLRTDMLRLVAGMVTIRANGLDYSGHLIDDALQDEREPVYKRHWAYRLNPRLVTLFAPNRYTLNNWKSRQQLRQKDLARWLQLWLESHAQHFATGVETIRERCGSQRAELRKFRFSLKQALDDLKDAGVIHNWAIDDSDLVHINRTPSDSQLGHIRKKTLRRKAERPRASRKTPEKRSRDGLES